MMRTATLLWAFLLTVSMELASTVNAADDEGAAENWIQLFNGKDLKGWSIKITGYDLNDNYGDTFRVEDGLLKVCYDKYSAFGGRFGHIFYETSFTRYVLRAEYRFVREQASGGPGWAVRNSGLMLHGQSPQSMRKDQNFPVSIEVQLLGGTGEGSRPTGNLCTPGTHVVMNGQLVRRHCTKSSSQTYQGDRWVTIEVEVRGNTSVRHMIEGKTVLEYQQPQLDDSDPDAQKLVVQGDKMLRGGYISLQAESHPVQFRKIELKRLID